MRYTTIIDLSEFPALYSNHNIRLVYLHLVVKCGYHDGDRDQYSRSIRALAADCGLTVSAVRNAIKQLTAARLAARQGDILYVRKWLPEQTITARPKSQKQQKAAEERERQQGEKQAREQQQDQEARMTAELAAKGKTPFMAWFEEQQRKAAEGDADAMKAVANKRHQTTYQQHAEAMANNKNGGQR